MILGLRFVAVARESAVGSLAGNVNFSAWSRAVSNRAARSSSFLEVIRHPRGVAS